MNKKIKGTIVFVLIAIIAGGIVAYTMWHKKRRDVADEKGIVITANQLVKEFQSNEASANKKYLNKTVEVTGVITKTEKSLDSNTTVLLASKDAFAGVYCTLKQKENDLQENKSVTIKGLCSGMLTDVRLREAVIINNRK